MNIQRISGVWIPIISIVFGLLAGSIIMIMFGYNPIEGYVALWNGAFENPYFRGETIRLITPYILSGLAVAFAFRTGLLNIGVEGQVLVGWLAAVWVGTAFHNLPLFVHLPLAIIASILAGGLWGFIPGYLKAKFQVHEVIITIMMNYIALYTVNALIRNVLTDGDDRTKEIAESASLKVSWLSELMPGSNVHAGIFLAIAAALFFWYFIEKTKFGFELKAVGFNPHASQYAGMSVKRNIILSMSISGGFAGLAGAMEGIGNFGYMTLNNGFTNIGFDGIAIALLGGNSAIGVVLAAGLFGILKFGALNMPVSAGVPNELVDIITALIIFFVAASYMIILFRVQIIKAYGRLKSFLQRKLKRRAE